jgi:1-acyl-sn-glycerol-3-phosphate acyltransferase
MKTMTSTVESHSTAPQRYNHARVERKRRFLRFLIRVIGFNFIVKLDHVEDMDNVPGDGPGILMINHINFVDPFIVLHALPRNIVPLAKIEVYNYPVVGIFPRMWEVIPVRREEVDRRAIQAALDVLKAGELILVAPEGTRGPALQTGKEGVAYLASHSGAPIIPVGIDRSEGFPTYRWSRRWRGPGAIARFGKPIRYKAAYSHPDRDQLRKMTDEAMYCLAALLPPERRGVYADLSKATRETLE